MAVELSPTWIGLIIGGAVVAVIALYLLLARRSTPGLGEDGELLRLEQPEKARRVPAAASSPEPAEMSAHAAPAVEKPELALLHERAKRRARTVVREIMMYNEEKLEKGLKEGNLVKYLGREIEVSRKLYQASIDLSDVESGRYFDESLLNILAGGDPSLLEER
jgi:hypothetical protein